MGKGDEPMSEGLTIVLSIAVCSVFAGWAIWVLTVNLRRNRSVKYSADIQSKLLDRFTDNQELVAFLDGPAGARFFESLHSDLEDSAHRILNAVQVGMALLLLGLALLGVRTTQDDRFARDLLLMIGAPVAGLGAGFLVAAVISYRLSRSWGLIKNKKSIAEVEN
jgi:hypothetical protein